MAVPARKLQQPGTGNLRSARKSVAGEKSGKNRPYRRHLYGYGNHEPVYQEIAGHRLCAGSDADGAEDQNHIAQDGGNPVIYPEIRDDTGQRGNSVHIDKQYKSRFQRR